MIEQIEKTTFKNILPCGETVEIGDKDSTDFKPHLKLNRWDGECFICPSLEQSGATELTVEDNLITSESKLSTVRMYPIAPSAQWELGSFRMEITHKRKPKSNKVISSILGHNVKAFYQPPLTEREIEEGCIQPDNIAGSYAFYHATEGGMVDSRGKDYMCGKFGHKPRPRIIDDNGDWCWAELFIDLKTGLQVITIPWEFYNEATYPIRHDAGADTFGYTTAGGNIYSLANTSHVYIRGSTATGASGTGNSISAYLDDWGAGEITEFCLYRKSDNVLVAVTGEDSTGGSGLIVLNLPSPALTAQDYGICARAEDYTDDFKIKGDAVSVYYYYKVTEGGTYPSFPNPFDGSNSTGNLLMSIFCTYTPAGAPPTFIPRIIGVI